VTGGLIEGEMDGALIATSDTCVETVEMSADRDDGDVVNLPPPVPPVPKPTLPEPLNENASSVPLPKEDIKSSGADFIIFNVALLSRTIGGFF